MPPAVSSTITEMSGPSNRRQPVRHTRTQPPKYAFSGARSLVGRGSFGGAPEERPQANSEPGFFPGLTHFTDSIDALPKEMARHFTMLKEVDAKIHWPEENLNKLISSLLTTQVPPPFVEASRALESHSQAQSANASAAASVNGAMGAAMVPGPSQASFVSQATSLDTYDIPRRQQFLNLRVLMSEMLQILEEKNHVIATTDDALRKHLARCESSWPEIEKEVSEETRWGNLHHWAYSDKSTEKKDARAERPRREAAVHHNFAAVVDDFGAVRGTGKRRAHQAQIESEIEETRANKRALGAGKGKKPASTQASAVGLGLVAGNANLNKRRKVEEAAANGIEMQRSLSMVFGKNAANKGASSPRSRSPAGAKKPRGGASSLAMTGKSRARAGTGASATNSPLMASSPVIGTFTNVQKSNASPAMASVTMGRQPSARGRQNSTQHNITGPTSNPKQSNAPVSTANASVNNGNVEGESAGGSKATGKPPKAETPAEEPDTRAVKREESNSLRNRPPSIATGTRNSGKASKTATPVHASFADATPSSRPRSNRATQGNEAGNGKGGGAGSPALNAPPKRSHKKGAGLAAQQAAREEAAARAAAAAAGPGVGNNDGADDDVDAEEEATYCYCNGPSYGDMVGCDGEGCEREWFHLDCIGLSKAPAGKAKWYCNECKRRLGIP